MIVFEDEVTPDAVRQVYEHFRRADRRGADDALPRGRRLLVAAGPPRHGGGRVQAHGDRRATRTSSSPTRRARNRWAATCASTAAATRWSSPTPPSRSTGEPLFVKLVEQGRIVYRETFEEQAARADRTWGKYTKAELSPRIAEYMHRFNAMRASEVAAARQRLTK